MANIYLENRLQHWAWWYVNLMEGNLPNQSTSMFSLISDLGILVSGSKQKGMPTNEAAEEINTWVNRMELVYPLDAQALRDYYFKKSEKLKDLAEKHKTSVTTFKKRVHDAKKWLDGRISAEKDDIYGNNINRGLLQSPAECGLMRPK
jgi:hypothetical protein